MKKKNVKKIIAVSVAALSLCVSNPVFASSESILERLQSTETMEGVVEAEDTNSLLTRGNHLNLGQTKISKLSSHEVNIYGLSQCHHVCDKVYLTLSLEWKVDGSYATYKIWDLSKENATSFSRSYNVIVPSGHYYRVRGYHAAYDSGVKESTSTLTDGILVK